MEVSINACDMKVEPFTMYTVPGEGVESLEKIPKEKLNSNTFYLVKIREKVPTVDSSEEFEDEEEKDEKEIVYYNSYVYSDSENKFILVEKELLIEQDPLNQKE